LFRSCGEHIQLSKLPLNFRYNGAGVPSTLTAGWGVVANVSLDDTVSGAIKEAIQQWDGAWPVKSGTSCNVLCYAGSTGARPGAQDGIDTIGWGDPSACDGQPSADTFARACKWYSDAAHKRIKEVDIILNPSFSWSQVDEVGKDRILGDVLGAGGGATGDAVDLGSVLTHELGHSIGLEDVGGGSWPGQLFDAVAAQQTMYHEAKVGQTNKRTIDVGDIAGVQYQAALSLSDA
jgi:hypothetical protein